MDTYYPKLIYYYYDWDKTPAGIIFLSESTKLKHGTCNHLPQIWIWGQYIGGKSNLYSGSTYVQYSQYAVSQYLA